MNKIPAPPPGFELDEDEDSIPPPPDGFELDEPAPGRALRTKSDSAIAGALDTFTFGLADELAAGIEWGANAVLPGGDGRSYAQSLAKVRAELAEAKEDNPGSYFAGQIAGGVTGGVGMAKGGLSLGAKAAQSGRSWMVRLLGGAADGGIQAAAYGAGSGGDIRDRAGQAVRSGLVGLPFGAAGEGAAMVIGTALSRGARGSSEVAKGADPAANVAQAAEHDIPLSRAQATGSPAQGGIEEGLRGKGLMKDFDLRQQAAVDDAIGNLHTEVAGDAPRVAAPGDAFAEAQTALRAKRDRLAADSREGYGNSVDDPTVTIPGEAIEALPKFIRGRLAQENIVVDPTFHTGAAKALDFVENAVAQMPKIGEDGVKGVQAQLKWAETLRVGLRKNFPAIGQDASAIRQIGDSLDEWSDKLFEHNLVSGSEEVLAELKKARASWAEFKGMVSPKAKMGDRVNPNYAAQARVRDMVEKELSPDEIGSYLFGSSVANPKQFSWATARELKKQLGPDSAEWNGVRQAVWLRATRAGDAMLDPDKIAKNLKGLLQENGNFAATLYSVDERKAMESFAGVMRNLSMAKAENARTAAATRYLPTLARVGSEIMGALAGGVGLYHGFDIGTSAGAAFGTQMASRIGTAVRDRSLLNTATRRPVPPTPSGTGGAAVRGGAVAAEEQRRPSYYGRGLFQ